jgi:uncharacterized protein (UPF0212 family)
MKNVLNSGAKAGVRKTESKAVYCPLCTHTVEAQVILDRRSAYVRPGQKCPRCGSALDAGYVMSFDRAA